MKIPVSTLLFLFLCMLRARDLHAQEQQKFPEDIVTDRPDQTEAPQLTPKNWLQVESGIQREFDKSNEIRKENTLYNTTLWKYGFSHHFELRVITEYAGEKLWLPKGEGDSLDAKTGMNPLIIGSKIFIQKQKGIIPHISLIGHLTLPYFGEEDFKPEHVVPDFRFLFSHDLGQIFKFSYNLGMKWQDENKNSMALYTAAFEGKIAKKLTMFIESYGFLEEDQLPDHRADGGLMFFVNPHLQLDCSAGIGLMPWSPDYFISGGISFRVNAFDKERRISQQN